MKIKYKLLFTVSAALAALSGFAQGTSSALTQERKFNLEAIRLLDAYEFNSTVRNNEAAGAFKSLFADPNQTIYNDLLGLSTAETLPIGQYVELLRGKAVSPVIKIKNVRKKSVTDNGDKMTMVLTFDKEMRYNNKCGAILSSKTYYEDNDYNMEMVISMDKATGEAVIESLTGSINSDVPRLDENFAIVELADPRDRFVTNNGERLRYNVFDQAFIPSPYKLKYPYEDANMKVVSDDQECNQLHFKYNPIRWSVRPYVSIPIGNAYDVRKSEDMGLLDVTNSGMEFGLDIGYTVPTKKAVRFSIFTGVGFSSGKVDMNMSNYNYHYNANSNADMDGDTYTRYYELGGISQSLSLKHLFVPLYFDLDFRLHRRVSLYLQAGAKAYFNMGSKSDYNIGRIYSYGIYPQYQDLFMADSWLNNFGESSFNSNNVDNIEFNSVSIDAFGGAGFRVFLVGPLSLEAGVTYQFGVTDVVSTNNDQVTDFSFSNNQSISPSNALISYTVSGGTQVRNLTDYTGSFKRTGLKVKIGLILKF